MLTMLGDLIRSGFFVRYFLANREGVVGWSILSERESLTPLKLLVQRGGLCLEYSPRILHPCRAPMLP